MLRNAISVNNDSSPVLAAATDVRAIAIGPPSCFTLTVPRKSPPRTSSTERPICQVANQPAEIDSPTDMDERTARLPMLSGPSAPAPILPTRLTVPVVGSFTSMTSGSTTMVSRCTPRASSKRAARPVSALTFATSSLHDFTGTPSTEITLSPRCRPAFSAGLPATSVSMTVGASRLPYTANIPVATKIVSTAFMVTPASRITTRAYVGFDSNQRFAGTGFGPCGIIASGSQSRSSSAPSFTTSLPPSSIAAVSSLRDAMRT